MQGCHVTLHTLIPRENFMTKKYLKTVICPKCSKERTVGKWSAGILCNSCRAKINLNGRNRKRLDLTNLIFGRLAVTSKKELIKGRVYWICRCICGNTCTISATSLRSGRTRSCGCLSRKHGLSSNPAYKSYSAMISRCYKKTNNRYKNYGGRGITVCDRWKESFSNFLEDIGERPYGTSLGRINNDDNYYKENCRWESYIEQANNKSNSAFLTAFGKTMTINKWAKECGIKRACLSWRLKSGWSLEEALTKKSFIGANQYGKKKER